MNNIAPMCFHYLDPCPLYLSTTSCVLWVQNKCCEPNSAFCTTLCYVFLHLNCFLQSLPHTLDLTEFSIVFSYAFTYFHTFPYTFFIFHIFARICTHFFTDFLIVLQNFQVKGLKGFVRIGSEIAFVTSNCTLFLNAQINQPSWIFSKSSEPLLQTLAQNPAQAQGACNRIPHPGLINTCIWSHTLCTFSEGPEQPARLDFPCLLNPCSQPLL